jgi:hypothetical protein
LFIRNRFFALSVPNFWTWTTRNRQRKNANVKIDDTHHIRHPINGERKKTNSLEKIQKITLHIRMLQKIGGRYGTYSCYYPYIESPPAIR